MFAARRIAVVGTSGSGKTSLAAELAERLGVPHIELDAIYHQPNWTPMDTKAFRQGVDEITRGDGWVIDGNYSLARDLIWGRAEAVVWLDYSRAVVMSRIVRRSLGRVAFRRRLWNGNRERWRNLVTLDPKKNIVLWAWTTHASNRQRVGKDLRHFDHLDVVRLASRRDARRWLAAV